MASSSWFAVVHVVVVLVLSFGVMESRALKVPKGVNASPSDRFIITVDAGSTGSRVHVHLMSAMTAEHAIPTIKATVNKKLKPGLSSFADQPADAAQHVNSLVDFALTEIPMEFWDSTPIYLKATAGLRSIPREQAERILEVCRASLAASRLRFEYEWAKIIPGSEEGMFSWIAVNYLHGRFHNKNKKKNDQDLPLLGVLEMGGASLQISYPLEQSAAEDEKKKRNKAVQTAAAAAGQSTTTTTTLSVQLDKTYELFSHSYLGYGLEKAMDILSHEDADQAGTCYPAGYNVASANLYGKGNYSQCYSAITDTLLDKSKCPSSTTTTSTQQQHQEEQEQRQRCSLQGIMLPPLEEGVNFVAIENFFYTTSFFKVQQQVDQLPDKGKEFCATGFDELEQSFPDEGADMLMRYCFSSAYINALLEKGFGIQKDSIQIAHTVGDTAIDWAVGSVIYDMVNDKHGIVVETTTQKKQKKSTSSSPTEKEAAPSSRIKSLFLYILPLFVLLLTAFFLLRGRRRRRRSAPHSPYQSIPGTENFGP